MGYTAVLLSVFAIFFVICNVDSATASSRCPPPSAIYEYSKKEQCRSDSECSGSKVCCVTPARNRACVQPAFGSSASSGYNKPAFGSSSSSGYNNHKVTATGTYCGNTKCSPFEKCGTDSRGKPICKRF